MKKTFILGMVVVTSFITIVPVSMNADEYTGPQTKSVIGHSSNSKMGWSSYSHGVCGRYGQDIRTAQNKNTSGDHYNNQYAYVKSDIQSDSDSSKGGTASATAEYNKSNSLSYTYKDY